MLLILLFKIYLFSTFCIPKKSFSVSFILKIFFEKLNIKKIEIKITNFFVENFLIIKITENNNTYEKSLDELIKEFNNVDIVVVEGFKKDNHPKIEILTKSLNNRNKETINVIAVVSNNLKDTNIPIFKENDIENLVEFIIKKIL